MIHLDRTTHTYTVDGKVKPSPTQILSDLKLSPPYPKDDPNDKKGFGSACHKAAELRMLGRLGKVDHRIQPYIAGLEIKMREMKIVPIETELIVYNRRLDYAGQTDLFCRVYDGRLAVIDYKTGAPPPCVELQLAGYADALIEMSQSGMLGIVFDKPPLRYSMHLTPGRAIVKPYEDDYDYAAWRGAVALWRWKFDRRK